MRKRFDGVCCCQHGASILCSNTSLTRIVETEMDKVDELSKNLRIIIQSQQNQIIWENSTARLAVSSSKKLACRICANVSITKAPLSSKLYPYPRACKNKDKTIRIPRVGKITLSETPKAAQTNFRRPSRPSFLTVSPYFWMRPRSLAFFAAISRRSVGPNDGDSSAGGGIDLSLIWRDVTELCLMDRVKKAADGLAKANKTMVNHANITRWRFMRLDMI